MNRIGYIGSKYKLKDWIFEEIEKRTDGTYTKFADLFAGSCIMTHEALERKYECFTNDLEPYSYIIANGLKCNFTPVVTNAFPDEQIKIITCRRSINSKHPGATAKEVLIQNYK